jgi:hypothetical protein
MAQVVEHFPRMHEALSSISNTKYVCVCVCVCVCVLLCKPVQKCVVCFL